MFALLDTFIPLRDLTRGIYSAVLADRSLDAVLSAQAAKSPIRVEVSVEVDPRPPAVVETTAYFIVGETLTTIAKHPGATEAAVKVWRGGNTVVVEVTDNGHGGDQMRPGTGSVQPRDRQRPGVSHGAVEKHIGNIFAKLGLEVSTAEHRRVREVLTYLKRTRPESTIEAAEPHSGRPFGR